MTATASRIGAIVARTTRGAFDGVREQDYEVRYWTQELNVSTERLREAVKAAGTSVEAVRQYLKDKSLVQGKLCRARDQRASFCGR